MEPREPVSSRRLHQLSGRLVNITRNNKSIRLLRQANTRCIDLCRIDAIAADTAGNVLRQVIAGRRATVLSWRDAPASLREDASRLYIDANDELEEVETPEYRRVQAFRKIETNLTTLNRNVRAIEEETGASELYLGYPWITGNCIDPEGTFIQAPVMLFPVRFELISTPRREWLVQPVPDAEPIFNEALALALAQYHQTRLSEEFIEQAEAAAESEDCIDNPAWLLDWLCHNLARCGLQVGIGPTGLAALPEYKAKEVPAGRPFTLHEHAVVGWFPQADSALRYDYEKLIELSKQGQLPPVLDALLDSTASIVSGDGPSSMDTVREADTCWIIETDASQEAALLRSRDEPCLVVHGPPGTGKSQVICNLISDALSKGQRVLVCCQKRAALDVVFQRLEKHGLGRHIALVHDHGTDRAELYKRITMALEPSPEAAPVPAQTDRLAQSIDQATSTLGEIALELHKPRRCGLTARQLYSLAPRETRETDAELVRAAGLFNAPSLDATCGVLDRLAALEARLGPHARAWSGRESFAALTFADKPAMESAVRQLIAAAGALQQAATHAGENRPGAGLASRQRETLQALAAQASSAEAADALVQPLIEPAAAGRFKASLEVIQRALPALSPLPPRPPADAPPGSLELALALDEYNAGRDRLFRFFSGRWRRARNAGTAWLAAQGLPDTPESASTHAAQMRATAHWSRLDAALAGTDLQPLVAGLGTAAEVGQLHARAAAALATARQLRRHLDALADLANWLPSTAPLPRLAARAEDLAALGASFQAVVACVVALSPWLNDRARGVLVDSAEKADPTTARLGDELLQGLQDFEIIQAIDDSQAGFSPEVMVVYRHLRRSRPERDYSAALRASVYFGWLGEIESESRSLRRVAAGELDTQIQAFRADLTRRRELNRLALASRLHQRAIVPRVEPGRVVDGRHNPERPWKDLRHQVGKKRQLWSLRRMIERLRWPLLEVMPCWLVSPETLSAAFPLEPGLFDLAIFDEASQMAVQHGVPALYRAKRVVIAGDDQQLRPFDLFGALGIHEDPDETPPDDEAEDDAAATEAESILTLAKTRFPEELLNCHYRSKFEELIQFSNQAFYRGRLLTVPPAIVVSQPPIEWRRVRGLWEKRRNAPEATAVIEHVYELLKLHGPGRSIGVITFNISQKEEIENQIDRRCMHDPEFAAVFNAARNPESGDRDAALFVKNIENVQGDERDIILFSVGYAPDIAGRVRNSFGSLSLEGGDNRLNVAVSRSREKIIVVSSIEPEELNVATARNRGPRLLRQYLEYARAVSGHQHEAGAGVLRAINPDLDVSHGAGAHFESEFEEQVATELEKHGLVVRPQVGVSGYRIDLGIVDPADPSRYLLGIECDGATWHSARSVRERDVYRQRFLESRGWTIHRIWSRNWWTNPGQELERIRHAIRAAATPAPSTP